MAVAVAEAEAVPVRFVRDQTEKKINIFFGCARNESVFISEVCAFHSKAIEALK